MAACTVTPPPLSGKRTPRDTNDSETGNNNDNNGSNDGNGGDGDGPNEEGDRTTTPEGVPLPPEFEPTALKTFFEQQIAAARSPAVAVAVVKNGKVAWSHGYGFANIEAKRAATADTLFQLASISKTVVAVALMQLIEDPSRGLALDQDVSAKLPFTFRNPNFKSTPITYRMLLTHTSSLVDSDAYVQSGQTVTLGDSTTPLKNWAAAYVTQSASWMNVRPGGEYEYSNTGASIAGLLVEQISGQDLQTYCKAKIFGPLGMNESSWFLKGLDQTHIAMPYQAGTGANQFIPQGQYGYPDYPDGQLRSSANELAKYLAMFSQKGTAAVPATGAGGAPAQILKTTSVDEIEKLQMLGVAQDQGLMWYYAGTGNDRALGHNGTFFGISTDMWFDPVTSAGYVLLTNAGTYFDDPPVQAKMNAMEAMNTKLWTLSHSL